MKKTFFIFVVALGFTAQVQAESCMMPGKLGKMLNDIITDLVEDRCKDKLTAELVSSKNNDEYCDCLLKNKPGVFNMLNNSAIANLIPEKAKKDASDAKRDRLDRVYRFLNYEVSLQEQKYELTNDKEQVGCTAKEMGKTNYDALCLSGQCPPTAAPGTSGSVVVPPIKDNPYSVTFMDSSASTNKSNRRPAEVKRNLENAISNYSDAALNKLLKEISTKQYSKEEKHRIDVINADMLKSPKEKIASIDNVTFDANERIHEENSKGGTAPIIPSPYEIALQDTFSQADSRIKDEFKKDHIQVGNNACTNYDVFKVIDSSPTKEMMDGWATTSPEAIEQSLMPQALGKEKKDSPLVNFLRRNPVIAKNMISNDQRAKLAKALHGFATDRENRNLDKAQMIGQFSKFMKTTIKDLNNQNQVGSLLQCDLLAQSYAAASDPDMSLALLVPGNNQVSELANNMKVCQIQADNKLKNKPGLPDMNDIMKANELFALFDSEADEDRFDPEKDKGFQEFRKKYCNEKDLARLEQKHTKGLFRCIFIKTKKCQERARLSDSGKRERILEEYYKEHPELGSLVRAVEANTKKLDLDQVANKTNPDAQNKTVRAEYEKYVKPLISQRSMYDVSNAMGAPVGSNGSNGSNASIADAVNKAQESYSGVHTSSQIADYGHTAEPTVASTAAGTGVASEGAAQGAMANPGQYIPPFLDTPKATRAAAVSPKISSVDEARDVLEDMNEAPEGEKAELASKAKEYLNSQDQTNQDIADLQQKLADYEHKKQAAPAVVDNTRVAARAPASVNFTAPTVSNKVSAGSSQSYGAGSASSSSSGFAKLSSGSSVSKAAASYASALNQANETRADAKSPSLVVDNGAVFDFNNSPVSRAAGDLVIGTSLEPSDKLYAEISSSPEAMKSYLAQNLKEVPLDKVVSIKCKGAGCNANSSEILLVITKGSDNKYSIRSVSRDTKVARSHRIQDLNNEIKKAVQ